MATHEEVMRAVERVRALRTKYQEAAQETATSDRHRWDAIREAGGDRRGGSVLTADARVAESNAATGAAFAALGSALVDMHALGVTADRDTWPQGNDLQRDRVSRVQPAATIPGPDGTGM